MQIEFPLWYFTDICKYISSVMTAQSSEMENFSNNNFATLIASTFPDVNFLNKLKEVRGNCSNNSLYICHGVYRSKIFRSSL